MEVVAFQSFSISSPSFFHGSTRKTSSINYYSNINNWAFNKSFCSQQLQVHQQFRWSLRTNTQVERRRVALPSASSSSPSSSSSPKSISSDAEASTDVWLLEPIGDGDWKHIGVKVARPGSYEIVSSSVVVGRVPEKAGLVIPVATVSGAHARFEKRDGNLYVTDLNSTNGTYVNERKLNPGQVFPVPPGSRITFGDTHLAIFLVSKMENVKVRAEAQEASGAESSPADTLQTETATS